LKECEALLKQKENNIKNTIESKVRGECKKTRDEFENLSQWLQDEHEKVNKKLQFLLDIHKIELDNKYNSHVSQLEVSFHKKDKKIEKLTSVITKAKNKYKDLEDIIAVKDLKIIDLDDKLYRTSTKHLFDNTIEPTF
jgi:hypothetical protein